MTLIKNVEAYKTDNIAWREEFERSYLEWVHKPLINSLLDSINIPMVLLCEVINDTSRSLSKINGSLRTIPYPKLRAAADFLGIPPWLLFNHPEKNKKLRDLFTNINSPLKSIDLPYISEYKDDYIDLLYELEKRIKPYERYNEIVKDIMNFHSQKNYYDVVHGNWKAVFGFFNDISYDFSGGAKFSYRSPEGILKGNMRLNFVTNPRSNRQLIKSGWLSIETDRLSSNGVSSTIDKFISTAITDMEWIFDDQPWIFNIESSKGETILYTWHSLRTSNVDYDKIATLINVELPSINFKINNDQQSESVSAKLLYVNPFKDFIKIIKTDVKTKDKPPNIRRKNTLRLLLEQGIIKDGDQISLIKSDKTKKLLHNKSLTNATIIIEDNKPAVKWDYDNKVYSISRLTHIILVEFGKHTNLMRAHINGNMYWTIHGRDKSLYSMANDAIKLDKTC